MTTDAQTQATQTPAQVKSQLRVMRDVILQHEGIEVLNVGVQLAYGRGTIDEDAVAAIREAFPKCDFELDAAEEDDGTLQLRITGPPETMSRLLPWFEADPSVFRAPWSRLLRWRARLLTSPLRTLPDFLIIGTSKAGTNTLAYDLFAHPRVAAPRQKELFYFDRYFARGVLRYRANFLTRPMRAFRHAITGEATPTYLEHPQVPERVRRLVPNARLICILRDPVDRAHSLHQLKTRTGEETLSLDEAIDREEREMDRELARVAADDRYFSPLLHHNAYVWGGIYVDHLQRWTKAFPRDQLLVLSSDDYRTAHEATFWRVLEFLGLPRVAMPTPVDRNRGIYHPLAPATRARLQELFRPHNERLWEFLGADWGWNDRP